jgi:hypothetical protein
MSYLVFALLVLGAPLAAQPLAREGSVRQLGRPLNGPLVRFDKLEQRLAQLEKSEAEAIKQGEARIVELEAMSFQRIEGRMARLEEAGAIDNNIAALLGKPNASTLRVHSTDSLTKNIFAGTTAAPLADLLLKTDSLTLSACASTAKKPIMSTTPASIGAVAYYLGHLRSFQWSAPTLRDAYAAFTVDGKRQAVPVLSVLVTRAMSTLSTDSQVMTPQRIHPSTLLIPLHPPSSSLSLSLSLLLRSYHQWILRHFSRTCQRLSATNPLLPR